MAQNKKNTADNKKPKAKAASKPRPEKKATTAPKPPAPVGLTSGLTLNDLWIQVFEKNEKVDEKDRLNDDQIAEFMRSEFPSSARSMVLNRIDIARGKYNRGGCHKKNQAGKLVRPKNRSKAHGVATNASPSSRNFRATSSPAANRGGAPRHQKDFKSHKK